MDNAQHGRFKDAPWYPKEPIHILVGGAGGIGSWLTLLLVRAGFTPFVFDYDTIEIHNLGGQLFGKKMIGAKKVSALQNVVEQFTGEDLFTFDQKVDRTTPTSKYVISAFDNMKARQDIFYPWVSEYGHDPEALFIDSSLTAEQMSIYCIKGGDWTAIGQYTKEYNFLTDSEVEETPCTFKQTSHAAAMLASHITGFFTNHITNVVEKAPVRSVPFHWEYFIPIDLTTVQNRADAHDNTKSS